MQVDICKAAPILPEATPTPEQLEQINSYVRTPLTAQEVYVFSLRLCDTLPDRDFECFTPQALEELAPLFVGKTGILDHNWTAEKQVARVFATQVVREDTATYIKAWAYALRGPENQGLIRDIDGGIKKEVSIGCAVAKRTCSICRAPYGTCEHRKGQRYGGALCVTLLEEPTDAYEFSFVAVPAQRAAGVLKARKGGETMTLKQLAAQQGLEGEYESLEKQAALGQQYTQNLQQEMVRLGLALDLGLEQDVLKDMAACLSAPALEQVRKAWEERAALLYRPEAQLGQGRRKAMEVEPEFLI